MVQGSLRVFRFFLGSMLDPCHTSSPTPRLRIVSIEQLESLDLLLWHRSGALASEQALCDQSSITRRVQASLKCFGLTLRRSDEFWLDGDQRLLLAQRRVHQLARFCGASRRPLRLEAPHPIAQRLSEISLRGWVLGPSHHRGPGALSALLRERVIDAWIRSDRLAPPEEPEFTRIRLWEERGPCALHGDHPAAQEQGWQQAELIVLSEWAREPAISLLLEHLRIRLIAARPSVPHLCGHP